MRIDIRLEVHRRKPSVYVNIVSVCWRREGVRVRLIEDSNETKQKSYEIEEPTKKK